MELYNAIYCKIDNSDESLLLNTVNNAFTINEDLHINEEKFQVPIELSQKRIPKILLILSLMLTFLASLLL